MLNQIKVLFWRILKFFFSILAFTKFTQKKEKSAEGFRSFLRVGYKMKH